MEIQLEDGDRLRIVFPGGESFEALTLKPEEYDPGHYREIYILPTHVSANDDTMEIRGMPVTEIAQRLMGMRVGPCACGDAAGGLNHFPSKKCDRNPEAVFQGVVQCSHTNTVGSHGNFWCSECGAPIEK